MVCWWSIHSALKKMARCKSVLVHEYPLIGWIVHIYRINGYVFEWFANHNPDVIVENAMCQCCSQVPHSLQFRLQLKREIIKSFERNGTQKDKKRDASSEMDVPTWNLYEMCITYLNQGKPCNKSYKKKQNFWKIK